MVISNFDRYEKIIKKDVFSARAARIWDLYRDYVFPSMKVYRSGFALCGVYPEPTTHIEAERYQSVAEHMYSATWLAMMLIENFPEIGAFDIWRSEILETLIMHDLMESKIGGDIPDVSERNESEKNSLELKAAKKYAYAIPSSFFGDIVKHNFQSMQEKASNFGQIVYCIDKIDAILMGLAYERIGRGGFVGGRGFKSDEECIEFVGHNALVDNWFYSVIRKIRGFDCGEFFIRFVEEVICHARGWYLPWIERVENYSSWHATGN